jgi:hypothetical protein
MEQKGRQPILPVVTSVKLEQFQQEKNTSLEQENNEVGEHHKTSSSSRRVL